MSAEVIEVERSRYDVVVDGHHVVTISHYPEWLRIENATPESGWQFIFVCESRFGGELRIGFSVPKAMAADDLAAKKIGFGEFKRIVRENA